eukprot:CAMPEP_0196739220 /NCGR_PEP_ID=MMETSP1091-20130531/20782_1 /TAXON_ID=302021 /ORGANISM="Rhodomonas sp., Strain CCMP768" /LENGTH=59 /DNA_ID=CAMNT_0042083627 /DNA_START=24 /DNA_END=200 /DNA_ORIENTATION=-
MCLPHRGGLDLTVNGLVVDAVVLLDAYLREERKHPNEEADAHQKHLDAEEDEELHVVLA